MAAQGGQESLRYSGGAYSGELGGFAAQDSGADLFCEHELINVDKRWI